MSYSTTMGQILEMRQIIDFEAFEILILWRNKITLDRQRCRATFHIFHPREDFN